jgi:hypothetical protein
MIHGFKPLYDFLLFVSAAGWEADLSNPWFRSETSLCFQLFLVTGSAASPDVAASAVGLHRMIGFPGPKPRVNLTRLHGVFVPRANNAHG